MTGAPPLPRRPWGSRETGIPCPRCLSGTLLVHAGCLQTRISCEVCQIGFDLGDLARELDDAAFQRLEEVLGGRLSDRV